ncbi:hypothetical protein ANN_13157 [Periplaneta americana]|uniref:Uncharacterized protein n=1 Tax=Periplaneta americana TaxID=6978 RepID=A0ABQ8TKM4_PERAM|nr:hypothetical protein ANN_13157 [Periplaneta americana]
MLTERKNNNFMSIKVMSLLEEKRKEGLDAKCHKFCAEVDDLYDSCIEYLENWLEPMLCFIWMCLSESLDWDKVSWSLASKLSTASSAIFFIPEEDGRASRRKLEANLQLTWLRTREELRRLHNCPGMATRTRRESRETRTGILIFTTERKAEASALF